MGHPSSDPALRLLFGRAFLVQLRRGDLETAKLFARAFLIRGGPPDGAPVIVSARARDALQ